MGFGIGWGLQFSINRENQIRSKTRFLGEAVTALAAGNKDQAIKMLTHVVARDTEEVDAYLTLGILYRKKGWYQRAVDIHQRLLSRPVLEPSKRRQAMVELVLDFEDAGLLDRAVEAIHKVLEAYEPQSSDYVILARLHEVSGEWQLAADAWQKAGDDPIYRNNLSYAYAMEGLRHYTHHEYKSAIRQYNLSLKSHKENPTALLGLAEINAIQGKLKASIRMYDILQSVRPDLTGVIADSLERIILEYKNEGLKAFYLDLMQKQSHKNRVAVRFASWLARIGDTAQASHMIKAINPDELAPEIILKLVETCEMLGDLESASKVTRKSLHRIVKQDRFICDVCGELFPLLEWRCPKCRNWGTIKSRTVYELEEKKGASP